MYYFWETADSGQRGFDLGECCANQTGWFYFFSRKLKSEREGKNLNKSFWAVASVEVGSRCLGCVSVYKHEKLLLFDLHHCRKSSEPSDISRPSVHHTSSVKERTTSDLESVFSSSWPMSMMEVLWPRFSFWSLNSPPLDTGMLSRLAISWFTEDLSSSMYMASISLDTNLGNLPACGQHGERFTVTYAANSKNWGSGNCWHKY